MSDRMTRSLGVLVVFAAVCGCLGFGLTAKAASLDLAWDAPTSYEDETPLTDLTGFKLYYGLSSGSYDVSRDLGNVTTAVVTGLQECTTYYFTVTAYDIGTNESAYAEELAWTVPDETAPIIIEGPASVRVVADAYRQAEIPDLTGEVVATDSCSGPDGLSVTQDPTAGVIVGLGPTPVTVTVTDEAGNSSTLVITVIVDRKPKPNAPTNVRVLDRN